MSTEGRYEDRLPAIIDAIVATYDEVSRINHLDLRPLPSREAVQEILEGLKEILYPGYFGRRNFTPSNIRYHIGDRVYQVYRALADQVYRSILHECRRSEGECDHCRETAREIALEFLMRIPDIRRRLAGDVQALYDGDPAAKSLDEIIFSYPGLEAVTVYRIAHELYGLGVPLLPRIMTELAHSATGIDIHPGAKIGKNFFVDHGTGVVVGETCEIGDNVKIYQGVTLGALSFPKDGRGDLIRGRKRHPTICDGVTIYSGATLLGGDTVVGKGSTIGGNVWLTHSVPDDSVVVVEEPGLRVEERGKQKGKRRSGTAVSKRRR
ncbi:MAG: serine O-acetyltransferase EpsC [Phycisphaerae bacterium]|nr:serine O-acetyltransferase EpsC [Phycisphaerae bacterium]